jgi:hypothetical protein
MAKASYTLAFLTPDLMAMVDAFKTAEYPEGLAYLITQQLEAEYRPHDVITMVKGSKALGEISMKLKENPRQMFKRITAFKQRYGTVARPVDEMHCVSSIIKAVLLIYQASILSEMKDKGAQLVCKDLEKVMVQSYRQTYGKDQDDEDDNVDTGELTLVVFSGECHRCHK